MWSVQASKRTSCQRTPVTSVRTCNITASVTQLLTAVLTVSTETYSTWQDTMRSRFPTACSTPSRRRPGITPSTHCAVCSRHSCRMQPAWTPARCAWLAGLRNRQLLASSKHPASCTRQTSLQSGGPREPAVHLLTTQPLAGLACLAWLAPEPKATSVCCWAAHEAPVAGLRGAAAETSCNIA